MAPSGELACTVVMEPGWPVPTARSQLSASPPRSSPMMMPKLGYGPALPPVSALHLVHRRRSSIAGQTPLELQDNLGELILPVKKIVVGTGSVLQGQPVADNHIGFDFAGLDAGQQRLHIAVDMGLAGLQR